MMKIVFGDKQKKTNNQAAKIELRPAAAEVATTNAAVEEIDEDELIAVITAAINVCMASQSNLFIRKITRVGDITPVWSQLGRHEQTLNRL
ncbi:MAG: hypothetical protein K0Q99_692 [Clostridia bacterium]|nr:hypothetical protein [Clostridia bacterium]